MVKQAFNIKALSPIASKTTSFGNTHSLYAKNGKYLITQSGTHHTGLYSIDAQENVISRNEAAMFVFRNMDIANACEYFPEIKFATFLAMETNHDFKNDYDHAVWCGIYGYNLKTMEQAIYPVAA